MKPLIPVCLSGMVLITAGMCLFRELHPKTQPQNAEEGTTMPASTIDTASPQTNPIPDQGRSQSFHWDQLESTDLRKFIANLRNIGCPEATIRTLVRAEIYSALAQRPQSPASRQYARDGTARVSNAEVEQMMSSLGFAADPEAEPDMDVLTLLKAAADESDPRMVLDSRLEPKRALIEEWAQTNNARKEAWARSFEGREPTPTELTHLWRIEEDSEATLRELLTPEEWEQFQVTNSPLTEELANSLEGLSVTLPQFATLYHARKRYQEAQDDGDDLLESKRLEEFTLRITEIFGKDQAPSILGKLASGIQTESAAVE